MPPYRWFKRILPDDPPSVVLRSSNPKKPMKLRYFLPACLVLVVPLTAADVTLTASDGFGNSSFNAAGNWNNSLAPASGNDYFTGEFMLRTPTTDPGAPFAGDSLTVAPSTFDLNKALMLKGPGYTVTIDDFTVNGGYIRHAEAEAQAFVLAGNLTIGGTGARFAVQGPIDVNSLVSGSGPVTIDPPGNTNVLRTVTFSNAANTFTGNIVNNGRFTLAAAGRLNFVIGATGVNNSISGTGPATLLNGSIFIDVTGASSTDGDKWALVSAINRTIFLNGVSSGAGAWTVEGTTWTDPTNTYQFSEFTGILKVIGPDDDNDLYSNGEESIAGTDPNDVFSSPDFDNDGLPDGFEVFYFGDYLTEDFGSILPRETGAGDNDNDGYSNAAEAAATPSPTDPTNPAFTPLDTDGDDLIDGWEMHYFSDLDEIGTGNPDLDSGDNLAEQAAGSNPDNAASTPTDTDGNAILDVNEALQPYVADTNTLHLWHLDELEATALNPAVDAGNSPVALVSLANGATLWQPSLPAFGTALDTSANRGTTAGAILAAKPLAADDSDSVDPLVHAGANGAFTFEAIVRLDFDPSIAPASTKPMQIVSSDGEVNRLWQFRLVPLGATELVLGGTTPEIQFIKIGGGVQQINAAVPIAAEADAAVQGGWYHVAVTYNGSEATPDNLKIYWTLMDGSRGAANEIGTAQLDADIVGTKGSLTIGNEGRDAGSGAGATDNFLGLIDEVRISDIARASTGFYFGASDSDYDAWATANSVFGGPTDDDDGDSLSNDFERLFGLDANSGSSVNPIVVPFDKSTGQLRYTRRTAALTGASYTVRTSTDLSTWTEDTGANQSVTGTVGDTETVEVTLSAGLTTNPKLFVRIQAN